MLEFRKELEAKIAELVPALAGKVFLGMAEEQTRAPFAIYALTRTPMRTKTGIAKITSQAEISVYDTESKRLETMRDQIVYGLDRQTLAELRVLYLGDEYGVNLEKTILNAYTITFKIS